MSESVFTISAIVFIGAICPSALCGILAFKKNHSVSLWLTLGFFFNIIAIAIIVILPVRKFKTYKTEKKDKLDTRVNLYQNLKEIEDSKNGQIH
jgi:ABC-type microcin C transport system permease subunit YejE